MSAPQAKPVATFSADDERYLRENHVPAPAFAGLFGAENPCRCCGEPWPCPALRAVNRLREVEATNRRIAFAMARLTSRMRAMVVRLGGNLPGEKPQA